MLRLKLAVFFAKALDLRLNFIDQATRLLQTFFMRASKLGRIWKRPVKSFTYTRENRASLLLRTRCIL